MNGKIFLAKGIKMPRSQSSQKSISKAPLNKVPSAVANVPFQNPLSSVGNGPVILPKPSFGQTVKEGLAFGTGQAIAHRIVGSFLGVAVGSPSQQDGNHLCEKELVAFESCMKTKSTDDFCGDFQLAYTQCLNLGKKD